MPRGTTWSFVDSRYTIGPFPDGPGPAEQRVDLDATYTGDSGALVRWRFLQSSRPEIVPDTITPYSVHYTQLRSDRKRQVSLAFGADDAMNASLNGAHGR